MITRTALLQAVRSGTFVPFPHQYDDRNIKSQLLNTAQALPDEAMAELLFCLITKSDKFPAGMIARERIFFRHFING